MAVDNCSLFRDERNREPAVEPNLVEIVVELDSDVPERYGFKTNYFASVSKSYLRRNK